MAARYLAGESGTVSPLLTVLLWPVGVPPAPGTFCPEPTDPQRGGVGGGGGRPLGLGCDSCGIRCGLNGANGSGGYMDTTKVAAVSDDQF